MTTAGQGSRRLHFDLPFEMPELIERVSAVQAFLLDAGCSGHSTGQFALVAEEILTNILQYAWPATVPGHCAVEVKAEVRPDAIHVSLRTEDDGIAFDLTQQAPPDLQAPLDERPIGGLGIVFVRTMTEQQTYRREDGRNILEVTKLCPFA